MLDSESQAGIEVAIGKGSCLTKEVARTEVCVCVCVCVCLCVCVTSHGLNLHDNKIKVPLSRKCEDLA